MNNKKVTEDPSRVKQDFYDDYVTSGQAGINAENPEESARCNLQAKRPFFDKIIDRYFPTERKVRILDLGCGHGSLIHALKSRGYCDVDGVDVSPEQVGLAHSLGIKEVRQGDALGFLRDEGRADVICCFDLLEHLAIAQSNLLLRQVYHVLQPNGLLVAHVPNGEGLFGQRIRYGDLTHETCFTPKSIRQLLTPIGFRDIQCVEDRPIPHGLKSCLRRVLWDVGTLWPRLLLTAETGARGFVLSQNMLVLAKR